MSKPNDAATKEVVVEVYMAMQNAPAVYDYFITRDGIIKPNPSADSMPGLLQVVMAGMNPTGPQQLRVAGQFGNTAQFRIIKFY
jgi:hypothetical protein